jgi:peptide deformylase
MAKHQEECFDKLFQKYIPLKIVEPELIPSSEDLLAFDPSETNFYAKLITSMEILCFSNGGVGMAAVQCGIPLKLFIASEDGENFRIFTDCEYEGIDEKIDSLEGCLSLKDEVNGLKRFLLKRYKKIRVTGTELFVNNINEKYKKIDEVFSGVFAIVMQHEIDHNNDILLSKIGREVEIAS